MELYNYKDTFRIARITFINLFFLQEYNEVPDDMRDDEETRAELHQAVDDLRDRLWNICDERKEQAEKEHESVKNDGWLDDRLGLLSNQYITLMQVEHILKNNFR